MFKTAFNFLILLGLLCLTNLVTPNVVLGAEVSRDIFGKYERVSAQFNLTLENAQRESRCPLKLEVMVEPNWGNIELAGAGEYSIFSVTQSEEAQVPNDHVPCISSVRGTSISEHQISAYEVCSLVVRRVTSVDFLRLEKGKQGAKDRLFRGSRSQWSTLPMDPQTLARQTISTEATDYLCVYQRQ